jgi:uncharacterized protein (DUF1330 family)
MPAYCFFRCLTEHDPQEFEAYKSAVRPTLKPFKVRILALHPAFEQVEGNGPTRSVALIEFESMAEAQRWYHGPEYQAIKHLRTESGTYDAFIFGGASP